MFKGFQLLGDSNLLRFAMRHASDSLDCNPFTTRRIGFCESGLRVEGLLNLIKADRAALASKVLVLIGTNDILHCASESTLRDEFNKVRGHLDCLRTILSKSCKEVVFLTVPPIPRKEDEGLYKYFTRQRALNRNILSCTGPTVRALPLHKQFEDEKGSAICSLFEKTMGRGRGQRPDGIRLTEEGFDVMRSFLENNL